MSISEQQLINWSRPVSTSEDNKCQNVISQVTNAIRSKFGQSVSIFLQGSYRNNTNVRLDSDVDIVVRHNDYFYYNLQHLNEAEKANFSKAWPDDATYSFQDLKNDTEIALRAVFGNDVGRRNKCIEVKGNSYRVTADIIPCFPHKRFATSTNVEAEGIQFFSDNLDKIVSFPNQHYTEGVDKTDATGRMFKRTVRILKVLRNRLIDEGSISEDFASSFFIECLVYNVPNSLFIPGNYTQTTKNIITRIYNDMGDESIANNYAEVSDLKWLFRGNGKRTPSIGREFILKCWQHEGY